MPEDPFDDDDLGFGRPLPPEDRIWRHPSEVGGIVQAARRRREVSNARLIGFAVTASLLGSVVTVGALTAGGAFERTVVEQAATTTVAPLTTTALGAEATRWPEIVQNLEPSLARLEGSGPGEATLGSAIAFRNDPDGTYFVTSRDLLRNTTQIQLVLGGSRRKRAEVVGSDQYTNLALLKVAGEHIDPPAFDLANDPQAGADAVIVAAAPPASQSPSVAKALVGSVDNKVKTKEGVEVEGLLRTDANISAEAKGGALVDPTGSLMGIIVVMAPDETQVERFGYALPTKAVMTTAASLILTGGFPTQVWLGISGNDLAGATAEEIGIAGGAVLENVALRSPAAECGLVSGDVVTKLNTTVVDSMTRLVMTLRELRPSDTVAIEYLRNRITQRCYAVLARPPEAVASTLNGPDGWTSTTVAPPATTAAPAVTSTAGPPVTTTTAASSS